jgi:prepilin-type N-terminal cleavage/methylation domain-containing protein
MLARLYKAREEREAGFTLIELLVVIIIIGILAAIAIPIFLNQRKKGYVAADKAELNSISIAEESYATDFNGLYANTLANVQTEGYNVSTPFTGSGSVTFTTDAANDAWCATVQNSAQPGIHYSQSSGTGVAAQGTCSAGLFTAGT